MKKYPILYKIIIAIVLSLIAFVIPVWGVKIGLAFLAMIFFALSFRKFSWLIILIGSVITLSVLGIMITSNFIPEINEFFNYDFSFFIPFVTNINDPSKMNLMEADTETETAAKVYFNGTSIKITVEDNDGLISYPERIEMEKSGDGVSFKNKFNNRTAEIIIDDDIEFELFYSDSSVISITDRLLAKDFKIHGSVVNINDILYSENTMIINGSVINVNANLFSPDSINISGSVSNLDGVFSTNDLKISSSVSNISIDVQNTKSLNINASTLSGSIDYLDDWEGERYLDITASLGNMSITYNSGTNNQLVYSTSGKAKISVKAK